MSVSDERLGRQQQSAGNSHLRACGLIALWCVATSVCIALTIHDPEQQLRHPAVTGSAAITVGWMLLAWAAMVFGSDWLARWLWTLGFAALIVHLAFAFGLGHGWSHAAAVEHVREVGGYGEGIVVNYLFAVVWLAEVGWWWVNPSGRANRPRWVAVAVHGFLVFVVVNATVVFGPAERRFAYSVAILLVATRLGKMGKIGSLARNAP